MVVGEMLKSEEKEDEKKEEKKRLDVNGMWSRKGLCWEMPSPPINRRHLFHYMRSLAAGKMRQLPA